MSESIARMRLGDAIQTAIENLQEEAATIRGEADLENDEVVADIAKEIWDFSHAIVGRIEALENQ